MAINHTVEQGEHLSRIAKEYGFADYHTIWDHPENAELKQRRLNPNVLYPGDQVFIPDRQEKQELRATEQRHRFRVKGQGLRLRVVARDAENQPIANARCVLAVEGNFHELTTDADGQIEQRIARTAQNATLTIQDSRAATNDPLLVMIGHLDPVEEISGQCARLNNLGYDAGPVGTAEGLDRLRFRSAVEEFQCDYGLRVDGVCGPQTQAKLKEIHGC